MREGIRNRLVVGLVACGLIGATLVGLTASSASAATLTVTNCNNSGAGSLRQTVLNASSGDTINFAMAPPCSTISDPTGPVLILKDLTISGPGAASLAIDGSGSSELFDIYPGFTASISGLTLQNATASNGGAIYNSGSLSVTSCVFNNDSASASTRK
jgi:hypothetical protein